jgi:hypothetical protein
MHSPLLKGLGVAGEHRNATIVAALIASMTLAAALLLWLEPPVRGWHRADLLMAVNGEPVQSVTVQYAPPGATVEQGLFDCIVFPDGESRWQPRGSDIVVLVMGTPDDRLPNAASRTLLGLLGNLSQGGRLPLAAMRLSPDSDPRVATSLPSQAYDLYELLERKGVIGG